MWKKGLKSHIRAVSNAKELKLKSLIAKKNSRSDNRRMYFTRTPRGDLIYSLKNNSRAERNQCSWVDKMIKIRRHSQQSQGLDYYTSRNRSLCTLKCKSGMSFVAQIEVLC